MDTQAFLKQFNLKLLVGNDTFSYLYLKNGFLYTFSNLPQSEKNLCSESYDQKLSNKHFKITAQKLLTSITFFKSLYKNKNRSKRSNFITEIFSSLMFDDKKDLQNIHTHINDLINYNNHELLLEKTILQKLDFNEKSIYNK